MLHKSIMTQLRLMVNKRNFWVGMFFGLLYCVVSYGYSLYVYRNYDIASIESASSLFIGDIHSPFLNYFEILFPFIVVLPFSLSYFDDKLLEVNSYYTVRIGKKNYILSKAIACFCGSFLIIFVPFLINILLNSATFLENQNTFYDVRFSNTFSKNILNNSNLEGGGMLLFSVFLLHPVLYTVLYSFLMSIFSGVLGLFAYACSFRIRKLKVLIFVPVYALFMLINSVGGNLLNKHLLDFVIVRVRNSEQLLLFLILCAGIVLFSVFSIKSEYSNDCL